MGDVAVTLKVLPSETDIEIENLRNTVVEKINPICKVNLTDVEEIGFGLKAIKLQIVVPDEEGRIDKVEGTIASIPGVGQVDTEEVTLI